MVTVPAQYDPLLKQMQTGTGIPYNVLAAQASAESGFQAGVTSSAGAEGWLQFLPSTYNAYAKQAGVKQGTEFDPASEAKVYVAYMNSLLKQFGGNLRNALAAYNAGPGNLQAGYGYADSILRAANTGNITVDSSTQASTAGLSIPGLGGISVSGVVNGIMNTFLKAIGLGSMKDLFERLGLIILGFVLVIVGIHLLSGGGSSQPINITTSSEESATGTKTSRKVKTPVGTHQTTRTAGKGIAGEAVEAAALA